jgi:hypothetical protein
MPAAHQIPSVGGHIPGARSLDVSSLNSPAAIADRRELFSGEAATPPRAAALRAAVESGLTVAAAGERLGMTREGAKALARRWEIKAAPDAVAEARAAGGARKAQARERKAEDLRALVERGLTVAEAGRELGMSRTQWEYLARLYGIRAAPEVLRRAFQAGSAMARREPPREAPPNPYRTKAQNDAIRRAKTWRPYSAELAAMPAPTADEAARLVAEFLARKGAVTQCPPAAPIIVPTNGGMGWR